MYSRGEASQLRREFWTAFGQYMQPLLSADGGRVNWLNYRTGEKDIFFRMEAGNGEASIAIELTQKDAGLRQLYFNEFLQLKKLLEAETGETWNWQLEASDDYGKQKSRIYTALPGVNIFNREHWPQLISFFKPRLLALDAFWSNVRYHFEMLR